MPLPPGQPALRRAVGAGPLLSMPGFCVTPLRHSRQLSTRDGDVVHRGAATVQTEQNNPFGLYRFDRFE